MCLLVAINLIIFWHKPLILSSAWCMCDNQLKIDKVTTVPLTGLVSHFRERVYTGRKYEAEEIADWHHEKVVW